MRNLSRLLQASAAGWRVWLHEWLPRSDNAPTVDRALPLVMQWLARAQDRSRSADGGVARDFSLKSGWNTSYPETTGYIVPTFLTYAADFGAPAFRARARAMLDWLISIQFENGAFQGGRIDSRPAVPVVFNTGQILLGLVAGAETFGEPFTDSARRAADWLVAVQDEDGAWRQHASPFAASGVKTYDTHVAWALFEAGRLLNDPMLTNAATANIEWAIRQQNTAGWFAHNCLSNCHQPLTHTIGYALRGVAEGYLHTGLSRFLHAATAGSDALLVRLGEDGFLAGRYDARWRPTASWSCLTGSAQIACCWFRLYEATGEKKYLEGARRINRYLIKHLDVGAREDIAGALKGSHPINGEYCPFEFPNWAAKFMADALIYELVMDRMSANRISDTLDVTGR